MSICPSCSADNADDDKFCSKCGHALRDEDFETISREHEGIQNRLRELDLQDPYSHGQFLPGTRIGQRYRIVSILGTGAMGEVYRADDLKLGHPVALKFLPFDFALDALRIEYFHREVRLSRKIAHANVCRVYDIGEVDGRHFLSMEFIDGEDLRSLLRRIGRLPNDKGIDVARQLCAGLASSHNQGVLHRDLKPANVMIDGRGQVRITDFGLARLIKERRAVGERVGTPAYMAPEQFEQGETTVQSDLYSLGLIFYELFTGVSISNSVGMKDLHRTNKELPLQHPSAIVDGLDAEVERSILACLSQDPTERPSSAQSVAAMLPGGNSLDVALALGETPSPAMVAASRQQGLSPLFGGIMLSAILLGMVGTAVLSMRSQRLIGFDAKVRASIRDSRDTSNDVLDELGFTNPGMDSVRGIQWNKDYFDFFEGNDEGTREWVEITGESPTAVTLWFRRYTGELVPEQGRGPYSAMLVTPDDPPITYPGMTSLRLNSNGQLRALQVVLPTVLNPKSANAGDELADGQWRLKLLIAAGIDPARLEQKFVQCSTKGLQSLPVYADLWEMWKSNSGQFAIEMAAVEGRPVFFEISPVASRNVQAPPRFLGVIFAVTVLGVFGTAFVLARRNWKAGRADRQGAIRMFGFIIISSFLYWLFQAHHVLGVGELVMTLETLARALFRGALICAAYLGLEPYVRRLWPGMLVGWNRLLAGRFTDPIVGRDILIGVAGGVAAQWFGSLGMILGVSPQIVLDADPAVGVGIGPFLLRPLLGPSSAMGQVCAEMFVGLVCGFVVCLLFLYLLRVIFRQTWLAATVLISFFTVPVLLTGDLVSSITVALWISTGVLLLNRFGVLTVVIGWVAWQILAWPITSDFTATYIDIGAIGYCLVCFLVCYGYYIANRPTRHSHLAGQRG